MEVRNTPPPGPAPVPGAGEDGSESGSGGQGLIGLAERARLAGGELTAGPADGGFRVRAWLPWPAAGTATGTAAGTVAVAGQG
ncbi:hypothetical protein ACIBCT_08440 [Streptosporangium sp. NPDC050855]|uniref:hypothetical protein n=1 Tax=Streptosporangium sp. NPDC050855 TaxID=3366194 RepID=UPI0037A464FF